MSRLARHQEKSFILKVFVYGAVLIALVIFLFTTGLKFLINTTVLMNGIGTKDNQNVVNPPKTDKIFGTISVDSIPVATNSAQFFMSGSISGYDKVEFYINGEKVKDITPNSDYFTEKIGDLHKGNNEVYLLAKSSSTSDTKQTKLFTVQYSSDKPALDISDPKGGSTTNKSEIAVIGKTGKEIVVQVNDLPVVVDIQGKFQTTVRLKNGDNIIIVVATDEAGNTETKKITIKYQKDE